jgi:hypothetical protein
MNLMQMREHNKAFLGKNNNYVGGSKPLDIAGTNDIKFVKEMLKNDNLGGLGVASILKINDVYNIFEFQLIKEAQVKYSPHTATINGFWYKAKTKFIVLKNLANALNGNLFLVHYAEAGTKHADKVKVVKVKKLDFMERIVEQKELCMTRDQFSRWYRYLNRQPLKIPVTII